jgi:hypothetical protein
VGGYRRPTLPVNPPVSVDFVLDFSTSGVADFSTRASLLPRAGKKARVSVIFGSKRVDLRLVLPDNLFARRVLTGDPTEVRRPVRRQDAGDASPHTRLGFLPRSAPASPCCGDGSLTWFANVSQSRVIVLPYSGKPECGRCWTCVWCVQERGGVAHSTVEGVVESLCGMRVS